MYWLMTCRHRADAADLREQHRDAHRLHVSTGGDGLAKVLIGSPLTEDDGETPVGHFGVLEASSRDAAAAFARQDPYALAGIVESIELTARASRFQANRIDPMTRWAYSTMAAP